MDRCFLDYVLGRINRYIAFPLENSYRESGGKGSRLHLKDPILCPRMLRLGGFRALTVRNR